MELSTFNGVLSGQHELTIAQQIQTPVIKNNKLTPFVPTFQDGMAKIQEASLDYSESISFSKMSQEEFQKELQNLPTLLQKDKAKARRLIGHLVTSAKEATNAISSSLSSAPIHPYERLIYDYLGANFVPPTIEEYQIPVVFNPVVCVRELEKISRKISKLEMTHYACISAEAMNQSFDGTFAAENLNNVFATPTVDSEGNQAFVINKEQLAEHLKFAEMVRNIPADFIVKNPLAVAKIILSEFIRIHKVEDHEITEELMSDKQFSLQQIISNPFEVTKELLNNHQMLNGGTSDFDLKTIFEAYERLNNLEFLQSSKTALR